MKTTRFIALLCLLALALTAIPAAGASAEEEIYRWIKTNTGVGLKVRSSTSTKDDSNVVDVLPYGTQVRVDGYEKNGVWALISVGGARGCYVATRYLVDYDPGKYTPQKDDPQKDDPKKDDPKKPYTVDFKTFKHVTPYLAMVSTGSPTGRVYLRWAPGTAYAYMDVCYQGTELTILAEGDGWCQVIENKTGYVGFMSKKFIVKK